MQPGKWHKQAGTEHTSEHGTHEVDKMMKLSF